MQVSVLWEYNNCLHYSYTTLANGNSSFGSSKVMQLGVLWEHNKCAHDSLINTQQCQVTLEDKKVLVVKSNGKRKREEEEEGSCKYLRLERKAMIKLMRKFRLPDDANPAAITAKCENGVLTVTVEKLPPPPESKPKTVEVVVA